MTIRVALTGGIGTGKSAVLARFAARGVPTVDADHLARAALAPGAPAAAAAIARFGPAIADVEGRIDRRALASIVFRDAAARRDLEAIVHPQVIGAIERWFVDLAATGGAALGLADVPLLYEAGMEGRFDRVVVVACAPAEQLRRVMARDGLSESEASARLAAQWPIDRKVTLADFVIRTDGSFEDTDRQVAATLTALESDRRADRGRC
jgi:dephospho-CoA kinase